VTYTIEKLCEVGKPIAMAMLAKAAKNHDTLTYREIADRISKELKTTVSSRHIGTVVGRMMDRVIEVDSTAPPINTLVVKKTTKLPGDGADWYVKRYLPKVSYASLSDEQKRAVLRPVHDAIFNFNNWDRIARSAFNVRAGLDRAHGESDGKASRLGFGGPAESEEHRRLKEFVAANPKRFGGPDGCAKGEIEKRLESYDEIDVWFMSPSEELAVEVKSVISNDLDIQRGLFQCVKYRALLGARNALNRTRSTIRTRIVSERHLTPKLRSWANTLGIEVQIIKALRAKPNGTTSC
jgi:hypothetical protein